MTATVSGDGELEFYRTAGRLTGIAATDAAEVAELVQGGGVARLVQGLMVHEAHAALCGPRIPQGRRPEMRIRPAGAVLARIRELDPRPLREPRPPRRRLVGF